MVMARPVYIYAYDPIVKHRVVYIVRNGIAKSLLTGHEFKYHDDG